MERRASPEQSGAPGRGAHDPFERVMSEQTEQIDELAGRRCIADVDADGVEQRDVVTGEVAQVEGDDAAEGGAFDDLMRARAHAALRVQDELAGVFVEAQQRHAGSLPF